MSKDEAKVPPILREPQDERIEPQALREPLRRSPESFGQGERIEIVAAAPIFAALGDQTRLGLVARLGAEGPLSITALTAGTGVTRQAVTKHLQVLAGAGLSRSVRHGREQIWELRPGPLIEAQRYLDSVSQLWDEALERLRLHVEE